MPSQKRYLVTGGAGFLGSHLCERLLARGDEVLCVDNFHTGRRSNVEHLRNDTRFELMRHDITCPLYVDIDEIFHLACPASPVNYGENPIRTVKTAVNGSINMLELAQRMTSKIFLASTSEIYGDPLVHPQPEGYWGNVNPIGPRACYDEGKRCAETLFFCYRRQVGLDIRVARIFNTYGPLMRVNDGRVIANFIVQALRGEEITVFGDGAQTRSFCYVDDMIDAFMRFMDAPNELTGPLNIGNPEEVTMLTLAEKVRSLTGSRSRIAKRPLPDGDPRRRCPDITLISEALSWMPTTSLEDGLRHTIDYFDSVLAEADR